jgi:hypothetical protein
MTKELTVFWPIDAWHFEKEFARACIKKYNHAEYIQKKVKACNENIIVCYWDSETGENEPLY